MNHPQAAAPQLSSVLVTGFAGIALVLLIAALIIAPFEHHFFMEWVAVAFMAATPPQMILGLFWKASKPEFINGLSVPMKGLALTAITIVAGALILFAMLMTVGGGHGVTPMLTQYAIMTVVCMLWILLIWHCWPITLFSKNPVTIGVLALVANYFVAYLLWYTFFDYGFLETIQHPHYYADIDPGGLLPLWDAATFFVSVVGVIVLHILFDFWPIEKLCAGKGQPIRGIVGSVYVMALAYGIRAFFVDVIGMEQVEYMVRVPVCLIFGTFLVNNMMQHALFPTLQQPLKGLVLSLLAAIAAVLMYELYAFASTLHAGQALTSGPQGGYQLELWIASAMLGVTFPIVFLVSGFFGFWPLKRS